MPTYFKHEICQLQRRQFVTNSPCSEKFAQYVKRSQSTWRSPDSCSQWTWMVLKTVTSCDFDRFQCYRRCQCAFKETLKFGSGKNHFKLINVKEQGRTKMSVIYYSTLLNPSMIILLPAAEKQPSPLRGHWACKQFNLGCDGGLRGNPSRCKWPIQLEQVGATLHMGCTMHSCFQPFWKNRNDLGFGWGTGG